MGSDYETATTSKVLRGLYQVSLKKPNPIEYTQGLILGGDLVCASSNRELIDRVIRLETTRLQERSSPRSPTPRDTRLSVVHCTCEETVLTVPGHRTESSAQRLIRLRRIPDHVPQKDRVPKERSVTLDEVMVEWTDKRDPRAGVVETFRD